jgi:hypothetical protein
MLIIYNFGTSDEALQHTGNLLCATEIDSKF